jgi:hypothetical protein
MPKSINVSFEYEPVMQEKKILTGYQKMVLNKVNEVLRCIPSLSFRVIHFMVQ